MDTITKTERDEAIECLEKMKDDFIIPLEFDRYYLPEYFAIETAIKSLKTIHIA